MINTDAVTQSRTEAGNAASMRPSTDTLVVDDRPVVIDPRPTRRSRSGTIPHRPGLDGLRGVAVAGVLAHHFGYLPGGYLGVDLFFVLSGFLITSLLLAEYRSTGRVSLGAFWARRAQRLLPAVLTLLVATALWARFGAAIADRPVLREESLAGLFYVSNWQQITSGVDYWSTFGALSPLRHMWSLAIEEQFYVLWPIVATAIVARRGGRWSLAVVAVVGAVASEVIRFALYDPDLPTARLYFGTDTRISAIFFGVIAACLLARPQRARIRAGRRALLEVAAFVAMGVLGIAWVFLEGTDPLLYRGGFTVCALAAAVVVSAAAHRRSGRVAEMLSWAPLRYLGRISYGLYLWHWPVVAILDERRMGFGGVPLALFWLAVSLLLAEVSFHVVETPIRQGRIGFPGRTATPTVRVAIVLATVGALVGVILWGTALSTAESRLVAATRRGVGQVDKIPDDLLAAGDPNIKAGKATIAVPPVAPEPNETPPAVVPKIVAPFPPYPPGQKPRVMIVGDSVADSLAGPLQATNGSNGALVLNRALVGCPLISSVTKVRASGVVTPDQQICTTWRSVWGEGLAKFKPNAAVLILGNPGSVERWLAGAWRTSCSPEVRGWITERVGDAIDLLSPSVGRVAVATLPATTFPFARAGDPESVRCKNEAIRAAVSKHPESRVIELGEWVCPAGSCRGSVSEGVPLRKDGLHFDAGDGGRTAGRWILQQLGVEVPAGE